VFVLGFSQFLQDKTPRPSLGFDNLGVENIAFFSTHIEIDCMLNPQQGGDGVGPIKSLALVLALGGATGACCASPACLNA
jgi:hypothetical protein